MATHSTKIYSYMTSPKFLRDKINNFVKSLKVSDKLLVSKNSTVDRLINIINIENFDNKTNKEIDFFVKNLKYQIRYLCRCR